MQVPLCRADPVRGGQVNVVGHLNIFHIANQMKDQVKSIVYASRFVQNIINPLHEEVIRAIFVVQRCCSWSTRGLYSTYCTFFAPACLPLIMIILIMLFV